MSEQVPFFMATDEIAIDSRAPWMEIAYREMKKGTKEFKTNDTFAKLFYVSLVQDEVRGGSKHPLLRPVLEDMVNAELKEEKTAVAKNNAEIGKFLASVRTDPKYGKSSPLPVISHESPSTLAAKGKHGKGATASRTRATRSPWLNFGTPLASPVPGCITFMPPMSSTGGGTGHVGFFVKRKGALTFILGGNQNDEINVTGFKAKPVGYRWPTKFNHLLASSSRLA